jgi:hypothetical protein
MNASLDRDQLLRSARRAGFPWSDADLEAIRPLVESALRVLAELESLPLDDVEPAAHFRVA